MKGETPIIYGDGEQTRDFTYIANVVEANLKAANSKACSGEAINVANGERVSLNRLLDVLKGITGHADVAATYNEERKGDVKHSQANNSLAEDLLEYEILVGLEEGLKRTIDWWKTSRFAV
jgi:nucleoside-diphosphate-sugar epimerase